MAETADSRIYIWVRSIGGGILASSLGLAAAFLWFVVPDWADEPALAGELRARSLAWEGRQRDYLVYVPSRIAASPKLVFVLHGSDGSGQQMRAVTGFGFEVLAERDGDVVVYPDGYANHWNDCRRAGPYAAKLENVDDVGFLKAVAGALAETLGVAWTGVFATGLSNGGHMALRLALEVPEWVTAVAPIAANLPVDDNLDCAKSGRPTGLLLINGTEDPMNPYDGGEVSFYPIVASRGEVHSSAATAAYFAALAGHNGTPSVELYDPDLTDGTSVEVNLWSAVGHPSVALAKVIGGGHTVPQPAGRLPRLLGRTSRDIDSNEVIWRFFATAKLQ